jgi:proteasome accessory factor C
MLALVPWILANPGTTIAELAARFEVSEAELEADLGLLPMCGLPPYTADRLIDVWVADDGAVSIRLAEYFDRPLRLSPAEGVALLAAGRALLGVPGSDRSGPLATALDKLEQALGTRGGLAVDVGDTGQLERLNQAVEGREQLEIDYYSSARDEMTTRVVDPGRVFHAFGAWYLAAYCHRAQGDRLFRVDRVRDVRSTGEHFDAVDGVPHDLGDLVYQPSPDDARVKLRLEPEAAWVVDSLPVEDSTRRSDGRFDVTLAVSGPAFLERLLLALGPQATIVAPRSAKKARAEAASRVLRRYTTSA